MRRALTAIAVSAVLIVPACRDAAEETVESYEPSTVEAIEGSEVARVTLEAEAAELIELQTTTVTEGPAGAVVPGSAVWIDVEGREWVYTSPAPLTYVRAEVLVSRYDDGRAFLSDGPPVGTEVVSVGVPELIGAEFGI